MGAGKRRDGQALLYRSIQFKMASVRSEKPICAPPSLSEFSPNVAFETDAMFVWLITAFSRSFKEDFTVKRRKEERQTENRITDG